MEETDTDDLDAAALKRREAAITKRILKLQPILEELFKVFRVPLDEVTLRAWCGALFDMTDREIAVAIGRAKRECTAFPVPAVIRGFATSTRALNDEQRAELAWNAVKTAMRREGYSRSVDFSDRLVNAAIRNMGGWESLFERNEETVWTQREFVKQYTLVAKSGVGDGSPLFGFVDRENLANGYGILEPPAHVDCKMFAHVMQPALTYVPVEMTLDNQRRLEVLQAKIAAARIMDAKPPLLRLGHASGPSPQAELSREATRRMAAEQKQKLAESFGAEDKP